MTQIRTKRIRDEYPDFVKRLRTSTKDFIENISFSESKVIRKTHYDFIKYCYHDDVNELEKIIFFTSFPFYEFEKAYDRVNYFFKSLKKYPRNADYVWENYTKALESGLRKITYKNNKFYFEGEYVPTNPYNEKLINIAAFDLLTEFCKFGQGYDGKTRVSEIVRDFIDSEFIKNYEFGEVYYCYETDESISGK